MLNPSYLKFSQGNTMSVQRFVEDVELNIYK